MLPGDPLQAIGDLFSSFVNNAVVQMVLMLALGYLVVLWLAAAFWAFRDIHERTENPVLPYLAAGLIILFTPVFFVFGVIVYRIVRPAERLGEVYERNLAEEALLAEVEAIRTCRGCNRRVNEDWLICPTCRTRLNRVCPNCERLVGLDWTICAWCAKDFEAPAAAPARVAAVPSPVEARQPMARASAGLAGKPATGR